MWLSYLVGLGVSFDFVHDPPSQPAAGVHPAVDAGLSMRDGEHGVGLALRTRVSSTEATNYDNGGAGSPEGSWRSTASLYTADVGLGLEVAPELWLVQAWVGAHVSWGTRHDRAMTDTGNVDRVVNLSLPTLVTVGALAAYDSDMEFLGQEVDLYGAFEITSTNPNPGTYVVATHYTAVTFGLLMRGGKKGGRR